jgi:hypothetical protein
MPGANAIALGLGGIWREDTLVAEKLATLKQGQTVATVHEMVLVATAHDMVRKVGGNDMMREIGTDIMVISTVDPDAGGQPAAPELVTADDAAAPVVAEEAQDGPSARDAPWVFPRNARRMKWRLGTSCCEIVARGSLS